MKNKQKQYDFFFKPEKFKYIGSSQQFTTQLKITTTIHTGYLVTDWVPKTWVLGLEKWD